MRAEFARKILAIAKSNSKVVFLSGDLGFMALEEVRDALGDRFINTGVAEQNMVSVAAGLAASGFVPVVYSIAPFATLRPYEQIRNDICLHNLPVKIVGNGGGYGYGIMGATHHALEDVAVMKTLPHMNVYVPAFAGDVEQCLEDMFRLPGPSYLRLGKATPAFGEIKKGDGWQGFRRVVKGSSVVIAAMGPVIENVINSLPELPTNIVDLWSVGQFPFTRIPDEFASAVISAKKVLSLEEHYRAGGLAESLGVFLANIPGQNRSFTSLCAEGYPSGLYGSQKWHQEENGLGGAKLRESILEIVNQ